MMTPYLPFSSERLHIMLGYDGSAAEADWAVPEMVANHQMNEAKPLFAKFDASMIDEENSRMKQAEQH
jgi:methionyl-tRNA synthetase